MYYLLKKLGIGAVVVGFALSNGAADAAGGMATGRAGYAPRTGANAARMPTQSGMNFTTMGNTTQNLPNYAVSGNVAYVSTNNNGGTAAGTGTGNGLDIVPSTTTDKCADRITVDMCMNNLYACVNNGGVQGGINGLFNSDLRNAIFNGMGLCATQVDDCEKYVMDDNCNPIFPGALEVWQMFNTRKVQPEYYNFVLRKTGLTPYQAENTCLLLDRNTYGSSFTAVGTDGSVKSEYKKDVHPYNGQGDNKGNTQGADVNENTYDGNRGHYARWDATNGECLVRIAAYNKENLITNKWLGIGDDTPAEAWVAAGNSFNCNKDLFGFSLMNQTKGAALLGTTIGTGVGAAIGAGVGAHMANKADDFKCTNTKDLDKLNDQLMALSRADKQILNQYMGTDVIDNQRIDSDKCNTIQELYTKFNQYDAAVASCINEIGGYVETEYVEVIKKCACDGKDGQNNDKLKICSGCDDNGTGGKPVCNKVYEFASKVNGFCTFKEFKDLNNDVFCNWTDPDCVSAQKMSESLNKLQKVFQKLPAIYRTKEKSGATIGKGAAIGAATGLGAGGLATGITALVEQSNIKCRVGDDLERVALNKSHNIGSLKDFYVKWALNLPDSAAPVATVRSLDEWNKACNSLSGDLCEGAKMQVKTNNIIGVNNVENACTMENGRCVASDIATVMLKVAAQETTVQAN